MPDKFYLWRAKLLSQTFCPPHLSSVWENPTQILWLQFFLDIAIIFGASILGLSLEGDFTEDAQALKEHLVQGRRVKQILNLLLKRGR